MTLGDIIKQYREDNKMSMEDFSKKSTLSKGYISMLENNINPRNNKPIAPTLPSIKKIALGMNTDLDSLLKILDSEQEISLEDENKSTDFINILNVFPIELKKFPLLGEIACGEPMFCNEDRESYILSGTGIDADFCLRAHGDSMINARILDGDIVFIKRQEEVENGEIAAVIIDNEATLKRINYYPEQNMIILKPENSQYSDIILQNESLNQVRILGKAVAFQSDVK
jgi:repressor LexA